MAAAKRTAKTRSNYLIGIIKKEFYNQHENAIKCLTYRFEHFENCLYYLLVQTMIYCYNGLFYICREEYHLVMFKL